MLSNDEKRIDDLDQKKLKN